MPDIFINPENKKTTHSSSKTHTDPIKKEKPAFEKPKDIENSPNHNHNPLSTFCFYPHHITFVNEEPDETIILLVRRHVITNLGWLILVFLMLFAPLVLNLFPLLSFLPLKFQTASILFWYLLSMAIFIQGFLSWFYSVNIITNKRVIDVDFENLIYRKITDAKVTNIEDVTVQMGSVIRTLFGYGDVLIQTAAEVPEVEFQAVPHPDKIVKLLAELRLEAKH